MIARITDWRHIQREGIFEIVERFIGTNKNAGVVNAALILLHNKVGIQYGYDRLPANENMMGLWKKLVTEFLSENAIQNNGQIRRIIIGFFRRFSHLDLIKILGENKKQVYLRIFPFSITDELMLNFISRTIQNDDEFIEAGLEKNMLEILEVGIDGKNKARNDVVKVITNIMCSRAIYLTKIMNHTIWAKIVRQATKKSLTVYGAFLAVAILKSFGQIATQEQIYNVVAYGNIISKCAFSLNRNRVRDRLENCDLTSLLNKVIKLKKKTGEECSGEIFECIHCIQQFSNHRRDLLYYNPRPYFSGGVFFNN